MIRSLQLLTRQVWRILTYPARVLRDASRTCQAALGELDEALDVVGEDEWSDRELYFLAGKGEMPV